MNDSHQKGPTFREIAVEWGRANGIPIPEYGTPEWKAFYERWHAYAFADFDKPQRPPSAAR